jgi:hypothetical protein
MKKTLKKKKKDFIKLRKSWSAPRNVVPERILAPSEFVVHWDEQARLYLVNSLSRLELNLNGAGFFAPFNIQNVLSVVCPFSWCRLGTVPC